MRDRFFFFYDVEDGCGGAYFIYEITFAQPIDVCRFQAIMKEAEDRADNFRALSDEAFQAAHGITSFHEIHADYTYFREDFLHEGS
jgi:hypothetical protein